MTAGRKRIVIENERAVLFWDECAFVVQGVDRELAAQGDTETEATERFRETVLAERELRARGLAEALAPSAEIRAWWDLAT